jgi:hypothetical protein
MAQFILLLRGNGMARPDMSPEEMQQVTGRYRTWMSKVGATGQKLRDGEGRVVRRGAAVIDGPFAESKEVLGGYLAIEASDYDEAVRICGDCPHLDFGSIEIRQIHQV